MSVFCRLVSSYIFIEARGSVTGSRMQRQLVLDLLQSSPSPSRTDPHGLNGRDLLINSKQNFQIPLY